MDITTAYNIGQEVYFIDSVKSLETIECPHCEGLGYISNGEENSICPYCNSRPKRLERTTKYLIAKGKVTDIHIHVREDNSAPTIEYLVKSIELHCTTTLQIEESCLTTNVEEIEALRAMLEKQESEVISKLFTIKAE